MHACKEVSKKGKIEVNHQQGIGEHLRWHWADGWENGWIKKE